jgi:hypothetical protein
MHCTADHHETVKIHRANMKKTMKNFPSSIVREKLINVRPLFVLIGHLSFQAKQLFAGLGFVSFLA